MKISFLITSVNSKARYHPGIANLSAILKQAGYETDLLNINNLDYSVIEDHIKSADPEIIAASTNTHQYHYVKQILEFIGQKFKHIKIICGGVHPTLDENIINDIAGIDAICRSDGEIPLLEYVRSIEKADGRTDISNITFKRDGKVIHNKAEYYVKDLNELPFPDYSIFPAYENKDLYFPMRFLFNRGCPFNCTYCCNHILKQNYPAGEYVRYKKPQRVIDELLYFSERYNFDQYVIDDDIFTLNKKWLLEFCELYPESLKSKRFSINVRIGTIDREVLNALKEIGCHQAQVGLESGNDEVRRKVLGRKIKQEDIVSTARMIKDAGIKLHTFNMIGVPGETRGNVLDTIRLNRLIKPDETQLTVFYPYPYTSLGEHCINNKLVQKKSADSYFTESILNRNARGISMLEIRHLVNFFKVYVYWGWHSENVRKEIKTIIKKSKPYRVYDRIRKEITNKISRKKSYSVSNIEIKYWKKAGLSKGNGFYKKYLEIFNISPDNITDKSVGDFGCGPLGGILSILKGFKQGYPIDILAEEYNKWKTSSIPLVKFDGQKTDLPDEALDILFMTNVIDHTEYPEIIINEAYRLLRNNGLLFLHVHLRSEQELNAAHPKAWDEKLFLELFQNFSIDWYKIDGQDFVNGNEYRTLYGQLTKKTPEMHNERSLSRFQTRIYEIRGKLIGIFVNIIYKYKRRKFRQKIDSKSSPSNLWTQLTEKECVYLWNESYIPKHIMEVPLNNLSIQKKQGHVVENLLRDKKGTIDWSINNLPPYKTLKLFTEKGFEYVKENFRSTDYYRMYSYFSGQKMYNSPLLSVKYRAHLSDEMIWHKFLKFVRLYESIKDRGYLAPPNEKNRIVVMEKDSSDKNEIISGHHRASILKILGYEKVKMLVVEKN